MLSHFSMIPAMSVATALIAANMGFSTVFMIVMITMHIRIKIKSAADTAIELYSAFCQRHLCTAANTTANEHICFYSRKYACECAVARAVCVYGSSRKGP